MTKNLLVDWLNKTGVTNFLTDVQNLANKTSATNVNTVNTPNTPTKPELKTHNINMKTAVAPTAPTPTVSTVSQPWTITGNWPAFVNGQLRTPANNEVLAAARGQNTQQSRFIWFQQQPQQPTYPNTTLWGDQKTLLDKVNDGKYYNILSSEQKAINANKKEQEKYRTTSDALMDFQWDVLKNNGKMTEEQMKARYPEFADKVDVLKELQTELRPIVQGGMGVDADQFAQYYPELLQAKKLVNTGEVKKKSEKAENTYQELKKRNDKILKSNWEWLSVNGVKFARDANTLFNAVELAKQEWIVWGANDNEILSYIINNNAQAKAIWDEMKSLELTGEDKAMYGMKWANLLENLSATISSLTTKKSDLQPTDEEIESVIRGKEALDADFANSTLKKISTELWVSADSLEKKIYRAYKDLENYGLKNATVAFDLALPKSYWEDALWIKLSDKNYMSIMGLFDSVTAPARNERIQQNKQNVMDYTESVNREYEGRKAANLNPDIENYVNSRSMSNMLLQWDLQPFLYKSSWEAAQNVDNLVIMGLWIAAPEIVLPLMAADSYARESQESFEELMEVQKKAWIPQDEAYDNAQKWSVLVWLASSAVELWLEKVLWWVETTASKTFHDILVKDVAERTTQMVAERWLADLLKQWLTTQFRASFEEWMEEVFQQAIHNSSLKQYDPDQKITEWMLESFEWGFYNWMNLLAWWWDVLSNVQQNSNSITQSANQTAYQWGAKAREIVDGLNQWAYNAGVNTMNIVDTVKNKVTNKSTQWTTEVNQATQQDNNEAAKEKENKPWVFERVTDRWAEKITSTASAQDKLYKAQEPRMNVLSNKKNLERRRSNSDRANELIVQNGYKPTNTAERLEAHQNTLNKLWKQVKDQVNQWEWITVDQTPIIDALSQYIQEKRALNIAWVESELKALEKELNSMKKAQKEGKTDLPILENKKQVFNDIIDWKEQEASEVYKWGIKVITSEIWKIEDAMLSEIPWQFSQLKRDVWALLDSYEDVFKADMKNQRSKWLWLTETYSRIEWVWDIIEWVLWVLSGEWGKVVKWAWKILLGKSLAKAKNVDFLIKTWFEELSNEMKNGGATTAETTNTTPPTTPSTTPPTAPTQTSKNKVTSKKKSDSKNKTAEKTTKSVDKKVSNQYNTTDASSNTSSVNLSQNEEATTWTKSSSSWATPRGWELEWPTTAFSNQKNLRKTQTEWGNFDISNVKQEYKDNYDKVINWEEKQLPVWKVDGSLADDWKERDAIFSKAIDEKVVDDHWAIDKANLLWTIDSPDYVIKDFDKDKAEDKSKYKEKVNFIRRIPWENAFVLVSAERQNWFFILTNYEVRKNNLNRMMNELRRYAKRWVLVTDKIWDLTESLTKVTWGKNAVTSQTNDILNEETPQIAEEDTSRDIANDLEQNTTPQTTEEEQVKNKVTKKTPKKKAETKTKTTSKKSAVTDYINETPQNERGQMEEIEAEENLRSNETPQRDMVEETPKNKVIAKKTEATAPKQEENQTLTKVDNKAQPTQEQRKLIRDWLEKQDLNRDHPFMPILLNDISTKGVRDYVYGAISQALWYSGIDFNKATDFFKSIGIDPEWWEKEMKIAPTYYYKGKVVNEKNEDKYSEESKTKITGNKKNKVTNPSKVKESGLFNENEVDKGNKSEWLNPDALPLSDYREMQRLDNGQYYPLSDALSEGSIKKYIARKLTTELVGNYDEIIADEFDPENIEDERVEKYNDVIDMYEAYEKWDSETADKFANGLIEWKTAKEIVDQYNPDYEADLEVYKRLEKEYPALFSDKKIDLSGDYGKALREFANLDNETAQDIDYQELAEMSNETAQIPSIFEEDLQESNIRNLAENETAQTTEEEMNKVTKKEPAKPKNLVTAKIEAENEVKEETPNTEIQVKEKGLNAEENDRYSEIRAYFQDLIDDDNARIERIKNNTAADASMKESQIKNVENRISKYQEALAMGTDLLEMDRLWAELAAKIEENLKGQKRGWTRYFPVKESKVIENKDGSKVKYLTTTKWDTSVQWGLIEVTSPEWVKESFVVQKIGNWPREVRVSWNYMTVDAIQNLVDITNWEYKAPKKSEKSYKVEQTTSATPQEQFMDRFENVYDREDMKKELSKVEEWEDIVTGKKYKGTKAQRMQFYVDDPLYKIDQDSSFWARKYVGITTDRWEQKHYLYWIEYDYAKFLEDNPDIRNKPIEPLTLKQRIEDMAREDGIEMPWEWEEVKYEKLPANVSVREESKKTWLKRIAPDRVIWQQETFDEWYNNVFKAVSDLSHAVLEEDKYNEYYKNAIREWRRDVSNFRTADWKTIQDMWKLDYNAITDLWFKTRNSQEYNSLIKNIREANGNEAALKSIAKNLYIKRVSDDIGKHYIYPEAVYEWKPDLLKAKTKFEAYLKWYNTSFSSTDSRIDYSMKDTLWAWVKRQDWNQITKAQKDWILANSLYYGRMFNLDIKKLFSDLWITVVHLNWKNPFLTKSALWVYNPKTKSISVWNGEEKYSVWKGKDKQTKSVATTFGHELTHAIDFMLDKELFSDEQTRPLLHTFNSVVSDRGADYWDSKVEVTARMVEQYLWIEWMWRRDYFKRWWYWNEELYNTYIKPAVESAFKNKLWEYYKEWWSAIPEGLDIDSLIDEAGYDTPNSVTATDLNRVTSRK